MTLPIIIIVLAVGLILLTLEIVALPGGVAGVCGGLLLVFGIWQGYALLGTTGGSIILGACVVLCVVLLAILMKTKTWKKFTLHEESDSTVNQIEVSTIAVGARGTTIARLAPTGRASIDGQIVEVHAINKYIDPDRPIVVVAIDGYRIDVREEDDNREL